MKQSRAGQAGVLVLSASLCLLGGCDTAPNPNFEQELRKQQGANTGDTYAALNNRWRSQGYLHTGESYRAKTATEQMLEYGATYESMLEVLDTDKQITRTDELFAMCRETFAATVAFWKDSRMEAASVEASATEVFGRLVACRDRAVAAGKSASNSALRRFASSGMGLIGLTVVTRGEEAAGLRMWQRADVFALNDKPDFKLTPKIFAR